MPDPLTLATDVAGIVSAAAAIAALYFQLRKPKPAKAIIAPLILFGAPINPGPGLFPHLR